MGIGDWGLGIGDWGVGSMHIHQNPITKQRTPIKYRKYKNNNL